MRDVIGSMMAHLGGEDYATEPQRVLVRRVAAFEAELVFLEGGFARCRSEGRAPDPASISTRAWHRHKGVTWRPSAFNACRATSPSIP
jgi:hypothetical protein